MAAKDSANGQQPLRGGRVRQARRAADRAQGGGAARKVAVSLPLSPHLSPISRKVAEGARRESRALAVSGDADERGRTLRQIVESIERSFDDAEALTQQSVRHPTDPSLTAVSVRAPPPAE